MVLFHYTGVVPPNTTELAPFHERLKIFQGTIITWIPYTPDECADLVKFWVDYHGFQLFPFNPDEWAYGFFSPVRIDEQLEILVPPYELDFYAINLDDTLYHEYHLYVVVEPPSKKTLGVPMGQSVIERLKELFGGE